MAGERFGVNAPEHRAAVDEADATVIARLADGDPSALGTLYDRHARAVYSLVYRIVRHSHDAEDVTQEAFSQVWQQARRYDRARATVVGWLLMIARTRALDRLRSRAGGLGRAAFGSDEFDGLIAEHAGDQEANAIAAQTASRLREIVGSLPDAQREVLHLAFYRGLTHSEIADTLNTPLGTIKTRLRTALMRLRDTLQATPAGHPGSEAS